MIYSDCEAPLCYPRCWPAWPWTNIQLLQFCIASCILHFRIISWIPTADREPWFTLNCRKWPVVMQGLRTCASRKMKRMMELLMIIIGHMNINNYNNKQPTMMQMMLQQQQRCWQKLKFQPFSLSRSVFFAIFIKTLWKKVKAEKIYILGFIEKVKYGAISFVFGSVWSTSIFAISSFSENETGPVKQER